ncbi:hypothetical protein NVP1031O_076 [Vibrio phage 1.031.O._10N.261.46.F8]|nr:hypothetical protein NVP1031O_076 [Vibrio phage 1.031.O._10N.261.46.F8]
MSTSYQSFQSKVLEMLKSIPADPTSIKWADDVVSRSGKVLVRGQNTAILYSNSEVIISASCECVTRRRQDIRVTCSINNYVLVYVSYRSEEHVPILEVDAKSIMSGMRKKLVIYAEDLYFELLDTDIR